MSEKIVVVALGHRALGTTLPEQKIATKMAAKAIADLTEDGAHVVISHSNGPQVGMIHTAMNEFGKAHPDYTFAPMSVCSAMTCRMPFVQNSSKEASINQSALSLPRQ